MLDHSTKAKANRLQNFQAAFDKKLIWMTKWEIADMDSEQKSDKLSLRKMNLSLKLRENNNAP